MERASLEKYETTYVCPIGETAMTTLYLCRVGTGEPELSGVLSRLSPEERITAEKITRRAAYRLHVYGLLLTRLRACKMTGMRNDQLRFARNTHGKPFLVNGGYHFNLSHTDGALVFAESDGPVGVDVEGQRKFEERLVRRFFTVEEAEYVLSGDSNTRFFEVWTRKEAFLKYTGTGITVPLNSVDVLDISGVHMETLWWERYCISCCGAEKALPPVVLTVEELLEQAGELKPL